MRLANDLRYWRICILLLLVLSLQQTCTQPEYRLVSAQDQFESAQFEDDPVKIRNNTEFMIQGWPGNGTPSNPYLLENLTIYDDDFPYNRSAIIIYNTNVFFIIRNCTLKLPDHDTGEAINLYNVTNGRIMNCTITIEPDYGIGLSVSGMYIAQSSNIHVTESIVTGGDRGVQVVESTNCSVEHSTITGQRDSCIEVSHCNDTTVRENIAVGAGSHQSQYGILVMSGSLNCSVISNSVSNHSSVGIRIMGAVDTYIAGNNVTYSGYGALIQYANLSRVLSNRFTDNDEGILIDSTSYQNLIADNILGDNIINAEDRGLDNTWSSNWYSDYSGIGVYLISGPARSVDVSPLPQRPHLPLLINTMIILSLIGLIPLGAAIGHRMRLQKRSGKEMDRRPSLLVMVLSVLLPCGISMALPATPLFQDLKYIIVDALFTLGVSRSPGADWTVGYYSSSIVSANDQVLLASVPYLSCMRSRYHSACSVSWAQHRWKTVRSGNLHDNCRGNGDSAHGFSTSSAHHSFACSLNRLLGKSDEAEG